MKTNFFSPLSFVAVFGSGIRDPGWGKIRIRVKHPGSAKLNTGINKNTIPLRFLHSWMVGCESHPLLNQKIRINMKKIAINFFTIWAKRQRIDRSIPDPNLFDRVEFFFILRVFGRFWKKHLEDYRKKIWKITDPDHTKGFRIRRYWWNADTEPAYFLSWSRVWITKNWKNFTAEKIKLRYLSLGLHKGRPS